MAFRRVALVMAGGSGTRFWPVSTTDRPKQFLKLASPDESLLAQSVSRVLPMFGDDVYVATAEPLMQASRDELPDLATSHVYGEPARRNTLGALVWSTARLMAELGEDWKSVSVAVLTADHLIEPAEGLIKTIQSALDLAETSGALVTIGIPPSRPATEYGYIEKADKIGDQAWQVARFTEKPDAEKAMGFIATGNFLWNSGMFFWTLRGFYDALRTVDPTAAQVIDQVVTSLENGDEEEAKYMFGQLGSNSIDYALMEKAPNVAVVAAQFEWDDLGSWDALSRSLPADVRGNVSQGNARLVDSDRCVVYNESSGQRVSILGIEDIVVAVTDGEVLVCKKDRAQDVRKLAD